MAAGDLTQLREPLVKALVELDMRLTALEHAITDRHDTVKPKELSRALQNVKKTAAKFRDKYADVLRSLPAQHG